MEPDLGKGLDEDAFEELREIAVAQVVTLEEGLLSRPDRESAPRGNLGLLMLEGLVSRRVSVSGASATDVSGPGDLIRPWEDDEFASARWTR